MPRQPRVPVRWGFVLMMGVVVFGVLGTALYYGSSDSQLRKDAVQVIKRTLGR